MPLDARGMRQKVEPTLGNLLLQLGVLETQHMGNLDPDERRKKLVKLAIKALGKLADGGDTTDKHHKELLKGSYANGSAMSVDAGPSLGNDELDEAERALSRRLGFMPPCE